MTKQQVLDEFQKCLNDPKYMIKTYFRTFDNTQGGYVPFKLFEKQEEIIDAYVKYVKNIIAKPRQAGVSTTTAAYVAVKMLLAANDKPETVMIVANKKELSMQILKKVREFIGQAPKWLGIKIVNDAKAQITLSNGSECKAVGTTKDAIRGYTPTFLIMDEAAFIKDGAEVYTTASASVSTGGSIVLLSTPNGYDDLYYKTYDLAKLGKNNFNIIEMRWYQDPRYNKGLEWIDPVDEDLRYQENEWTFAGFERKIAQGLKPISPWYESMVREMNGDKRKIAQELDCSFVGSGSFVIDSEDLQYQIENNVCDPIAITGYNNNVWVWEEPIEGEKYILTGDVARGDGEDYSCFSIIKVSNHEQVVEFHDKVQADILGEIAFEWGTKYNAYIAFDITGSYGYPTMTKLIDMGYKNIHYDTVNGKAILETFTKSKHKKGNLVPGFSIQSNRTSLIQKFEELCRLRKLVIRSERLISEIKTFIFSPKTGRPDHMPGFHDDAIFAIGIGCYLIETSFKNFEAAKSKDISILASWKTSDQINYDRVEKIRAEREEKRRRVEEENAKQAEAFGIKTDDRPKRTQNNLIGKGIYSRNNPIADHMWLFAGNSRK